jgi:membrane-associated protease RseP (regulator of RpoE activity)
VVAGVVMNLLLAWGLLTVGFWVGIEPLISTEEDFYASIYEGTANTEPGIVVVKSSDLSLVEGDRILVNSIEEWDALVKEVEAGKTVMVPVDLQADHQNENIEMKTLDAETLASTEFAPFYLPRLVYLEEEGSLFSGKLQEEDAIITVENKEILTEEDLLAALEGRNSAHLKIYRPGIGDLQVLIYLPESYPLITYIEPGSPAELAGLQVKDKIVSLNDSRVYTAQEVSERTPLLAEEGPLTYEVQRGEELLTFEIQPNEEGRVGIGLSDLTSNYGNLSLYSTYVPSTLMGFDEIQHTWSAPVVALKEMGRLSKVTALMFGNVLKQFVSGQGVPEGVAGPVGIAQMTFTTVKDGFPALLRFVALLSLSLGVINILPIPALDGGKFFFIAVQALTGKKMNAKYEYLIHAAGFFFLILLIVYITFNDVMALLS